MKRKIYLLLFGLLSLTLVGCIDFSKFGTGSDWDDEEDYSYTEPEQTENIIYNNNKLFVRETKIDYTQWNGLYIQLLATNESDENMDLKASDIYVNGISVDADFYDTVPAMKEDYQLTIYISTEKLMEAGVDQINYVDFNLHVIDYKGNEIGSTSGTRIETNETYYLDSESNHQDDENNYQDNENDNNEYGVSDKKILLDRKGIKVFVYKKTDKDGSSIFFAAENDSDYDILLVIPNISINGYDLTITFDLLARAGQKVEKALDFYEENLDGLELDDIMEIAGQLQIVDANSLKEMFESWFSKINFDH